MGVTLHDNSCLCKDCRAKRDAETGARIASGVSRRPIVWLGPLACLCGVVIVGFSIYNGADSNGWISHEVETSISAENNWFVGESRECTSVTGLEGDAIGRIEGVNPSGHIDCGKGPDRHMKVTFHGPEKQPENAIITWKCTREQDTFTCSEVSGIEKKTAGTELSLDSAPVHDGCHDPNEVRGGNGVCWCKDGYKSDPTTLKCIPE